MRILYCNKYNFGFSGTEAYLFETMELMRSRGHEVALFSMADARGAAAGGARRPGGAPAGDPPLGARSNFRHFNVRSPPGASPGSGRAGREVCGPGY